MHLTLLVYRDHLILYFPLVISFPISLLIIVSPLSCTCIVLYTCIRKFTARGFQSIIRVWSYSQVAIRALTSPTLGSYYHHYFVICLITDSFLSIVLSQFPLVSSKGRTDASASLHTEAILVCAFKHYSATFRTFSTSVPNFMLLCNVLIIN